MLLFHTDYSKGGSKIPSNWIPEEDVLRTEWGPQEHSPKKLPFHEQRLKVHENGPWLIEVTLHRYTWEVTLTPTQPPATPTTPHQPMADCMEHKRPVCSKSW